jgi:hypothetical protein
MNTQRNRTTQTVSLGRAKALPFLWAKGEDIF